MLFELVDRYFNELSAHPLAGEFWLNRNLFQFDYGLYSESVLDTPQDVATNPAILNRDIVDAAWIR
ncbi:MAG: hypothetical protein QNJ07_09195 [Woeseiaceae bacterium]|nr:hypothetical protein [Woeseiaceae bacterium]